MHSGCLREAHAGVIPGPKPPRPFRPAEPSGNPALLAGLARVDQRADDRASSCFFLAGSCGPMKCGTSVARSGKLRRGAGFVAGLADRPGQDSEIRCIAKNGINLSMASPDTLGDVTLSAGRLW
jgi:hypothetical protein